VAEIPGMRHLAGKIDKAQAALKAELPRALLRAGHVVAGQAQRNVSGPRPGHLGVVTNRLRSSISAVKIAPLSVKVGTNVVYAAIHEFGGEILPKRSAFLRFKTSDGEWHAVRRVDMPARPYMRPALDKKRAEVIAIVRAVYAGPLQIGGVSG